MESLGYGDEKCPECGHTEYSESDEDFESRMGIGTEETKPVFN